jgi:hypothetical protein
LAPLAEEPIEVPPLETVYQFIVYPTATADKFEESAQLIVEGLAVAEAGADKGATVTVTGTLVGEIQPDTPAQEIIT